MVSKFSAMGINTLDMIRELVRNLKNPAAGIMLFDVYSAFDQQGKNVKKED